MTTRGRGVANEGAHCDAGFTLVELIVGIGLFAVLMALVSVFMVTGLKSLKAASTANVIQAQEQNSMIDLSRSIRYIDNPVEKGVTKPAILQAAGDSMVFFTRSGTGDVDRLAYKVMVCVTDRGVESFTWSPELTNGAAVEDPDPDLTVPTCDDAGGAGAFRRVLMAKEANTDPKVEFRYYNGSDEISVPLDPVSALPTELTTDQITAITAIRVVLTDPSLGAPLEQNVLLVNER